MDEATDFWEFRTGAVDVFGTKPKKIFFLNSSHPIVLYQYSTLIIRQ